MAFINEKMTKEMIGDLERRKVFPDNNRVARAMYQTIDRENHMCLWGLGVLDRDLLEHQYFLFEREGETELLLLHYLNPSIGNVIWKSSYYGEFPDKDDMWKKDFIEALTTYGISGDIESKRDYNMSIDLSKVEKRVLYGNEPYCTQAYPSLWKRVFRKRIVWEVIILIIVLMIYGVVPK